MKKMPLILAVALGAATLCGEAAAPAVAPAAAPAPKAPAKTGRPRTTPYTMEEVAARRAKSQQILMQKVGGTVPRPGTQKGEIVYVNCQTRAPQEWINESVAYFAEETKFKIVSKTGTFNFAKPEIQGNSTLFVIDDEKLPAFLVAPDDRWAFVNIAPLAKERRPAFFQARVKKQLSRGFAYLCGAANSQYPMALTRGLKDISDVDRNMDYRLPVDIFQRFRTYMEPLGVTPQVSVIYRKAVQEGWAPAPTNEWQKAVWDKVHAMPKNPMKIEFDPKKGR